MTWSGPFRIAWSPRTRQPRLCPRASARILLLSILQAGNDFLRLPIIPPVHLKHFAVRPYQGSPQRVNDLSGLLPVTQPEKLSNLLHLVRAARSHLPVTEILGSPFRYKARRVTPQNQR